MKKLRDCILGRVFCSVLCLSIGSMPIYADNETIGKKVTSIKGKVITVDDQLPVIGASILIEGTKIGTVTDVDGNFYIANIPVDAKRIKVSYLGLKSQYVAVRPELLVKMVNDDAQLDEVMVVAYGTAKKSTFTGSASVIKTDKLDDRPVTEVSSALLGSARNCIGFIFKWNAGCHFYHPNTWSRFFQCIFQSFNSFGWNSL